MSDNPHANGGLLLRDLKMPDFREYAVEVPSPGAATAEATRAMGKFLRDVMKLNLDSQNFRLFSPDENNSNRWQDVLEVTNRCYMAEIYPDDDHLSPDGRVMEVLSEHQCQGWLEGYLLDRPARFLLLLRGVHPHHRFDVQPARQVAQGVQAHSVAAPNRARSTTCSARTSGGRTTTASRTRIPGSSTTSSTRRRRSSASTCRPTPTACSA